MLARAITLNVDRKLLVSMLFVVLSIGSALYLSLATLNYLSFYPAIDRLQSNVTKVTFNSGTGSGQPRLIAQIVVNNPTAYSGFRIRQAYVETYFFVGTNSSITLFASPSRLNASSNPPGQIPPSSVYSFELPIGLAPFQADQITSFNSRYSTEGVIVWVNLRVDISTFLVAATGTTILTSLQNVTLTTA